MPLLKFRCRKCGKVFDELVKLASGAPSCPDCGGETERAYEGKCISPKGGCSGNCSCCGGCHHE